MEVSFDEVGCKYDNLGQIVMPEEDYCLRMMRPEHLRHVCFDCLDVRIPLCCILYSVGSLSNDALGGDRVRTYFDVHPVGILPLPETVHGSDLHEITSILIKVFPERRFSKDVPYTAIVSHDKIQVEEVVEKPALLDHGISKDTS